VRLEEIIKPVALVALGFAAGVYIGKLVSEDKDATSEKMASAILEAEAENLVDYITGGEEVEPSLPPLL